MSPCAIPIPWSASALARSLCGSRTRARTVSCCSTRWRTTDPLAAPWRPPPRSACRLSRSPAAPFVLPGEEVPDDSGDAGRVFQAGEVAAVADRGGADGGYGPEVGVSLVLVRPVVVAVGEGHRDLDGRVAVAGGDPASPVAGQRTQGAAVTRPPSAVIELVDQLRAQVAGVVEPAFEHPAEHALGPGSAKNGPNQGKNHAVKHNFPDARAPPNPPQAT